MPRRFGLLAALFLLAPAGSLVGVAQSRAAPPVAPSESSSDLATAYYPAEALNSSVSGAAKLDCELTVKLRLINCKIISESPEGHGFGDAALKVVESIPDNPKVTSAHSTAHNITVVQFSASPMKIFPPPGEPIHLITNPNWIAPPTTQELSAWAQLSPAQARSHGSTRINCRVAADGHLYSCNVQFEDPVGSGYGEAALRIAAHTRMKPQLRDGEPVGGAKVSLPFHF